MNWLSKISVRAKLLLLLSVFTIGILGVAVTGWYSLHHAVETSQALVSNEVKAMRSLGDVRASIGNTRRFEKDLFLNLVEEEVLAKYEKSWREQIGLTRDAIEAIRPLLQSHEQEVLAGMQASVDEYVKSVEAILVGIQRGEVNDPWRANQLMEPSKKQIRAADGALSEIVQSVNGRVQEAVSTLAALQGQALMLMGGVSFAMVLLSMGMGYVISRRITDPLNDAVRAIERVEQGDLSVRVETVGTDETSRVLTGVTRMQAALSSIVSDIRKGVDSMTVASAEIVSGNADLSHRTERSASSLQQTAASMDEMASTVEHSHTAAGQARDMVTAATQTASRGGDVMSQVVGTMAGIQQSSQRIAEIIAVIDGIAFQTNILALNAAVESARAGEHGRGFAVVASEVRSLAGRSADAAKEIKSLIDESVERVSSGTRLVSDAGTTMKEIVHSVERVTAIINEMAHASSEQNNGIRQINEAITQLDQMTQQNATLVEQSSSAARSLRDQSNWLEQRVSFFKLA